MNAAGLHYPDHLYYDIEHQVWARFDDGGLATVGITALGVQLSGEVYMCRPKGVGIEVERGRGLAVVELAKSIVSVKSPLSGTVVAVNERLAAEPELVHADPYGQGWIAQLQPRQGDIERGALLHGPDVAAAMAHHAWLHRLQE